MEERLEPAPEGDTPTTDYATLYREAHPDAVEDPKKAELMAHASKLDEEDVVEQRRLALERAVESGKVNHDPARYKEAENMRRAADNNVKLAEHARRDADQSADFVGEIYDRTKNL